MPEKGLLFDGRIAEDFKLATGTWVSVGPLRAAFIAHCAPYVRDVVIAGADRDFIAALIFPDLDACRRLAPDLPKDAGAADIVAHEQRAARIPLPARQPRQSRDRLVQPRHARDPARYAALARCRRGDRQGLDQPAHGPASSRRAGARSSMPPRRRRALSPSKRDRAMSQSPHRIVAGRLAARRRAHAVRRLQWRPCGDLADRSRHQGGAGGVRALRRDARRMSAPSSPAIWRRRASTRICCRAMSGFIPACRSRRPRIWCSASAAPASR